MKKILFLLLTLCLISCENENDEKSSLIRDLIIENTELREENNKYKKLYGELPDFNYEEGSYGMWNVGNYVDDFGEPTKHGYVYAEVYGTFSNSATTDSKLRVRFLIDENSMRIQLYEYSGNHPIKGEGFLKFKAKNNNGELVSFETNNDDSGDNTYDDFSNDTRGYIAFDELIEFIDKSKMIKFIAKTTSNYAVSEYKFTIPDGSQLKEALNKAINKTDEQNESI